MNSGGKEAASSARTQRRGPRLSLGRAESGFLFCADGVVTVRTFLGLVWELLEQEVSSEMFTEPTRLILERAQRKVVGKVRQNSGGDWLNLSTYLSQSSGDFSHLSFVKIKDSICSVHSQHSRLNVNNLLHHPVQGKKYESFPASMKQMHNGENASWLDKGKPEPCSFSHVSGET